MTKGNKRETVLVRLDDLIKELYGVRMQDRWRGKGLAEAMTLLIRARAILTEERGSEI